MRSPPQTCTACGRLTFGLSYNGGRVAAGESYIAVLIAGRIMPIRRESTRPLALSPLASRHAAHGFLFLLQLGLEFPALVGQLLTESFRLFKILGGPDHFILHSNFTPGDFRGVF